MANVTTNFNVSPYYDDYDEDKAFLRVLFRPGYAVQGRELTQLQTILQKQSSRLGDHIFKDGSKVLGGEVTLDTEVTYLKLTNTDTATQSKTFTYTSNTAALAGDITITQGTVGANGATAYVVDVNASASTIRVVNITNGSNASVGYDGKPGSWQCTTTNVASGFTGVATGVATFTYTGGSAVLTNVANGAMQIGSGEMIYIENRAPVARASDQTEDIKLIIEF